MTNYGPVMARHCVECGEERTFEQPPCPDGHADCPEWVCVSCGSAYVMAWLEADAPKSPTATTRRGAA